MSLALSHGPMTKFYRLQTAYSPPRSVLPFKSKADRMIDFLRDYGQRRINSRLIDERRTIPPHIVQDLGREGFFGLQVPRQFGGLDLSFKDTFRVIQQLTAVDVNVMLLVGVHNYIGTSPIVHFASQEKKEEVLPDLASGRSLAALAASEAGAGANFRAITTTATKTERGYTLQGEKSWISLGSWAEWITIIAQLNGRPTAFLVKQGTEGLHLGEEAMTMGIKGFPQNRLRINNLKVPVDALLGKEGGGHEVAQDAFTMGRMLLTVGGIGAMKRCIQLASRYAERRTIATGQLIDNGLTLSTLEDMVEGASSLESLTDMIGAKLDRHETLDHSIPMVSKILGPELTFKTVDQCLQMLGARGYLDTNIVAQFFRDVRLCRIFEGPTETVAQFFGRRVFKDPGEYASMLTTEFNGDREGILLGQFVNDLRDRIIHGNLWKDNVQVMRQWCDTRLGFLASWAMLSAVSKTPWAANKFNAYLENTKRLVNEKTSVNKEALLSKINAYESSIGALEQSLPGEERDLDQWLRV